MICNYFKVINYELSWRRNKKIHFLLTLHTNYDLFVLKKVLIPQICFDS